MGAVGLVIGLTLPVGQARAEDAATPPPAQPVDPNAYVRIGTDSQVTVIVKHIEWGQGIFTGLATLVAEELDAAWDQMRAESAPADATLYGNALFGGMQATAGSTSLACSYDLMRQAGAAARFLLIQTAAQRWGVPASEIRIAQGVISHAATGRHGTFGEFAEAAAKLPAPKQVVVKDPATFRFIGRPDAAKRLDVASKVNGSAQFAMDINVPGMLTVVVAHPTRFGAKPAHCDPSAAFRVRGVVAVKQLSSGYAVFAHGMWAALKGRKALDITWDETKAEPRDSQAIEADYLEVTKTVGTVVGTKGDIDGALKGDGQIVEATFTFPYLPHAPMEPLDGYILWDGKTVQTRFGCPIQTLDQAAMAAVMGLTPDKVFIDTMFAGSSFGRRGPPSCHFAVEMAEAAKAIGPGQPLKLVWTREDDIQGGCYRPMFVHRLRGVVKEGRILGWSNSIAGQSLFAGTDLAKDFEKNGVDPYMIEGSDSLIYTIPNFRCDAHTRISPITTTPWRSTGYSHTSHSVECFVDMLLHACGKDPVAGRIELIENPRAVRALREVAKLAGWSGPHVAGGRARGVAMIQAYDSVWIAQIAEVSLDKDGTPIVHKIWCTADCGRVVNPDIVKAQLEGGIGWGMGHAMFSELPMKAGAAVCANFDSFRVLRFDKMPEVEIAILPSTEAPGGIGELGAPAAGPAIANAIFQLTGARPSRLPIIATV